MNVSGKLSTTILAVSLLAFGGWTPPAQAGAPAVTLDTFAPGLSVNSLAQLKLREQNGGKTLHGTVAWDGSELIANVRVDKKRIKSALLKGNQENGLIGMFISEMSERNMVPSLLVSDALKVNFLYEAAEKGKHADYCREYTVEVMGTWAGDGKNLLMVLFLPEKVFRSAGAALKASADARLQDILKPYGKDKVYALTLTREDDRLAFFIGDLENSEEYLKRWGK